jgi:uncharacterized protein YndB with AHSA1/START domain
MSNARTTDARPVLRLERTFSATRERVFTAMTDPAIVRRWSAPGPLRIGEASNDVRVGGRWLVEMIHDDADRRYVAVGRYLEIDRPARLSYTHAWLDDGERPEETDTRATTVTIELHDDGPRTRMVFTQTGFDDVPTRDGHHEGWDSAFDKLEALMATGQTGTT